MSPKKKLRAKKARINDRQVARLARLGSAAIIATYWISSRLIPTDLSDTWYNLAVTFTLLTILWSIVAIIGTDPELMFYAMTLALIAVFFWISPEPIFGNFIEGMRLHLEGLPTVFWGEFVAGVVLYVGLYVAHNEWKRL